MWICWKKVKINLFCDDDKTIAETSFFSGKCSKKAQTHGGWWEIAATAMNHPLPATCSALMIWCPSEPTPFNLWLDFVAFGLSGLQDNLIFRVHVHLLLFKLLLLTLGPNWSGLSLSLYKLKLWLAVATMY